MTRPTPYRPRVPEDLFAEMSELSGGTFKGLHELTLRYIREGIEKDRAVQAGKDRKVPGNWNFPFRDITILNWAEYYGFEVPKVIEAYAAMADVKVESVNVAFHLDGMDIRALNEIFFGENWERDIALRELAAQEDKAVKERMQALLDSQKLAKRTMK